MVTSSRVAMSALDDDDALFESVTGGKGGQKGRWTALEHKRFLQAIRLFGKDWRKVQEFIGTRSGAQIRSHAQKYFITMLKLDGNIELDENNKMVKQERGFTERSLNILLKKICDIESKQEAIAKGMKGINDGGDVQE
jgi:SHAQKYF class myb-like DNA-binding protein